MKKWFSDPFILFADENDVPVIRQLLNSAYRGESSRQGWTTEAHLIGGEVRTSDEQVLQTMHGAGSVFLKYIDESGKMVACVNLQQQHHKLYLGMFSVSPGMQGSGIGKKMLGAAEEYALQLQCSSIYMSVISVRTELIDWYKRNGYAETGERKPFEQDDISGTHLQPLEFLILEKKLAR